MDYLVIDNSDIAPAGLFNDPFEFRDHVEQTYRPWYSYWAVRAWSSWLLSPKMILEEDPNEWTKIRPFEEVKAAITDARDTFYSKEKCCGKEQCRSDGEAGIPKESEAQEDLD